MLWWDLKRIDKRQTKFRNKFVRKPLERSQCLNRKHQRTVRFCSHVQVFHEKKHASKGQNHRAFHRKKPTEVDWLSECLWSQPFLESDQWLSACDRAKSEAAMVPFWSFCGRQPWVRPRSSNPASVLDRQSSSHQWQKKVQYGPVPGTLHISSGMCHNWNIPKTSRKSPGLDKH